MHMAALAWEAPGPGCPVPLILPHSCPACCSHTRRGIQTGRIIICRGQGEEEEALHHQPFFSRTSTLRSCPKTQA